MAAMRQSWDMVLETRVAARLILVMCYSLTKEEKVIHRGINIGNGPQHEDCVIAGRLLKNSSHPCLANLNPTRMQPMRESAIGNDFRDADFRIVKGYRCSSRNGGRFGKLVWSEVDHELLHDLQANESTKSETTQDYHINMKAKKISDGQPYGYGRSADCRRA